MLQQVSNLQEARNDNLGTPAIAGGYADDLEASGIANLEEIAKPSYHFFRSQPDPQEASSFYQAGAMVHIARDWTERSPLGVTVFSNTEEVELFLNGNSLGRQRASVLPNGENISHPPFRFGMPEF